MSEHSTDVGTHRYYRYLQSLSVNTEAQCIIWKTADCRPVFTVTAYHNTLPTQTMERCLYRRDANDPNASFPGQG